MEKKCSKCGIVKSTSEFTKNSRRPDNLTVWCKSCSKVARDEYYHRNKEKIKERVKRFKDENPDLIKQQRSIYRKKYRMKQLHYSAKHRAMKLGLDFNIEYEDILIPEFCPVLGIKLDDDCSKQSRNSPSLDRIIPELGYTKGNVHVISWQANTMKNNASVEELKAFAKWVLEFFKTKTESETNVK